MYVRSGSKRSSSIAGRQCAAMNFDCFVVWLGLKVRWGWIGLGQLNAAAAVARIPSVRPSANFI
jgi:hypothetical protein